MNPLLMAILGAGAVVFGAGLLLKFWNRFQTRKTVEKLLKNSKNFDPRVLEDPKYGTLIADAGGFKLNISSDQSVELPWEEIEEICAFKKDLGTTDLICLGFKRSAEEKYFVIHEEMAGYHDLLKVMQKFLAKFDLTWFPAVAFPAFESNYRVIWKRSEAEGALVKSTGSLKPLP